MRAALRGRRTVGAIDNGNATCGIPGAAAPRRGKGPGHQRPYPVGADGPAGPIPCLRIGHGKRQTVLYPVADLQAWLSQQAEAVKGGGDDAR